MRQSVTSALAAVRKLMYECPGNANYYRFFADSGNNCKIMCHLYMKCNYAILTSEHIRMSAHAGESA